VLHAGQLIIALGPLGIPNDLFDLAANATASLLSDKPGLLAECICILSSVLHVGETELISNAVIADRIWPAADNELSDRS
jgi:hypothetical protein